MNSKKSQKTTEKKSMSQNSEKESTIKKDEPRDQFDAVYKALDDNQAAVLTVEKCLRDVKNKCLECQQRIILNVLTCPEKNCALHELRKRSIEIGQN